MINLSDETNNSQVEPSCHSL